MLIQNSEQNTAKSAAQNTDTARRTVQNAVVAVGTSGRTVDIQALALKRKQQDQGGKI